MLSSFDEISADIATRLTEGASSRHSPMHLPAVATSDADVRIMVLRAFDEAKWRLRFHTDARAPKNRTIGDGAPVGALFYDKPNKVQIRIRGHGRILREGAEVEEAWAEGTNFAKRCYLGEAPGTGSDAPNSGLPAWAEGLQPTDEQLVPARHNFAILQVTVVEADWFTLSNEGHRRAIVRPDGTGRWITP